MGTQQNGAADPHTLQTSPGRPELVDGGLSRGMPIPGEEVCSCYAESPAYRVTAIRRLCLALVECSPSGNVLGAREKGRRVPAPGGPSTPAPSLWDHPVSPPASRQKRYRRAPHTDMGKRLRSDIASFTSQPLPLPSSVDGWAPFFL